MTVSSETLHSISTPERIDSRLGTLDFVDGRPSPATSGFVYDHQRRYSPLASFFDKSWCPSEIQAVRTNP
jgi:hypothetical protein